MAVERGDCLEVMAGMEPQSVDAIVTDPPYGLKFMGKEWDHGMPGEPFWSAALRVAKPGAYLLAFGGTRTYHRLTCAIEDAGWEIRDCLMWLYGQGFPKGKACLKPAWEPVVMARAPGRAAHLRIDECRLPTSETMSFSKAAPYTEGKAQGRTWNPTSTQGMDREQHASGRWPANLMLDEEAAGMLDAEVGEAGGSRPIQRPDGFRRFNGTDYAGGNEYRTPAYESPGYGDSGGPSRFFYCAKASRREREAGLNDIAPKNRDKSRNAEQPSMNGGDGNPYNRGAKPVKNYHPTVKPVALMRWLCRLVTPPGGIILNPFAGSGTTGVAAEKEGFKFIGIEKEPEYADIAEARINHASEQGSLGI